TAAQLERIEAPDRVSRAGGVAELSEGEAAWLSRRAIHPDAHAHRRIGIGEHGAQLLLRCLEGQIANKDRRRNGLLLLGQVCTSSRGSRCPPGLRPPKASTEAQHRAFRGSAPGSELAAEADVLLAHALEHDLGAPAAHHPVEAMVAVLALEQAGGDQL